MSKVFVLDAHYRPLDPIHPDAARRLLTSGQAAAFHAYPFTIILKASFDTPVQPLRVKLDPGSKVSGIAVVNDVTAEVVFAAELEHRGNVVKARMDKRRVQRSHRRYRKTRYREARYLNRRKPMGWIAPSLMSRVYNLETWVKRLKRLCPIAAISLELVRFDTQKLQNPEISGVEYQQGELLGYEVREYLLEKWGRMCAYCKAEGVRLEVEHIVPKSRGGTGRISNLTISCRTCNLAKGNMTAAEFGHPKIQEAAKQPLRDAAAVNTTRWVLYQKLKSLGLPIEVGTGGRTKFNRVRLGLPKHHWTDAACVGASTPDRLAVSEVRPLLIKAFGHGRRQRCIPDKHGFPKSHAPRAKTYLGFQTGDMVRGRVTRGETIQKYAGRVTIRHRPGFTVDGREIHAKHLKIVQMADGYGYSVGDAIQPDLRRDPAASRGLALRTDSPDVRLTRQSKIHQSSA